MLFLQAFLIDQIKKGHACNLSIPDSGSRADDSLFLLAGGADRSDRSPCCRPSPPTRSPFRRLPQFRIAAPVPQPG